MRDAANNCLVPERLTPALIKVAADQKVLWFLVEGVENSRSNSFVKHMAKEIHTQTEELYAQLRGLIDIVSNICPPIALKGACFLIEQPSSASKGRFMVDLDLLVDRKLAGDVSHELAAHGYETENQKYNDALDIHLPPFWNENYSVPLELHTRFTRWKYSGLLDLHQVLNRCSLLKFDGNEFYLPSIDDRIVHLVAHSQLSSHRFGRRTVICRDLVDFLDLTSRKECNLQQVRKRFLESGYLREFMSFVALAELAWGKEFMPSTYFMPEHRAWASTVLSTCENATFSKFYLVRNCINQVVENALKPNRWLAIILFATSVDRMSKYFRRYILRK